jgi:hypothetical protein
MFFQLEASKATPLTSVTKLNPTFRQGASQLPLTLGDPNLEILKSADTGHLFRGLVCYPRLTRTLTIPQYSSRYPTSLHPNPSPSSSQQSSLWHPSESINSSL